MKLSIVSTLYQSAPYLEEFYQRVSKAAQVSAGDDYEFILVNDGSPDNSLDLAIELSEKDSNVVAIDLSRNFGHHKAMMTGLSHARGNRVYLIDSDLEEDPEWLSQFERTMKDQKCDVVYGVQRQRKGGWLERWSGQWFYRAFRLFTGLALPENVVTARLMSQRYVKALVRHDEREVFLAGLWHITGFNQQPFIVDKHSSSATTYTLRRKLATLVDSITSFSNAPLIGIFYFGMLVSIGALFYIIWLLVNKLIFAAPMAGWTSVMASIWLIGGMIISFIGIVGIYLSKIYSEVKRRPYTIVRQIYAQTKQ